MSRKQINELKPFVSVLMIVVTLLVMVFFKMEVRRMGYSVLKQARQYKSLRDHHRLQSIEFAKFMSPARLRRKALSQLPLTDAGIGQIIHISGQEIALRN